MEGRGPTKTPKRCEKVAMKAPKRCEKVANDDIEDTIFRGRGLTKTPKKVRNGAH